MTQAQTKSCDLCGAASTTGIPQDEHHVIYRSAGGIDGPTIILCRRCHSAQHDGVIDIDRDLAVNGYLQVRHKNGAILVSRPLTGITDTTSTDLLSSAYRTIELAAEAGLEGLHLDQLHYVCELQDQLQTAWPLRAEAVYRAYHGWLLWNDEGRPETRKTYRLNAISKRLNVSPGTARQEFDIASTFMPEGGRFASFAMQHPVKDFTVWRRAADLPEPWAALEAAQAVVETVENASVEQQIAAMEDREPRQWWVKVPEDAEPGTWVPMKDLERERR